MRAFAGPLSVWFAERRGDSSPEGRQRLRVGVEAWRRDLRASVAPKVGEQLEWDEAADVAATADLGDAGLPALRLLAFYAERSELEWPDTVPPLLELDPHWRVASDQKFARSLYGQLLACDVWLPGDFPVTMRAPLPDGDSAEIGSVTALVDQLRWLNQRTFQADTEALLAWRELAAPAGGDLLTAARRGYAALWTAASAAQQHRLPLVGRPA